MTALRDTTASHLSTFLEREKLDNPWSDRAGTSTRLLYSDAELYEADRLDFHTELVDARFAVETTSSVDETLVVVVTAGPPGAGKSTAVEKHPEFNSFRSIDADDFKDDLLVRANEDGLLDRWLSESLPDGGEVRLRELATFVHAESTVVAAAYRAAALERGENVLVHGTLADPQSIDDLLGAFDLAGYERLVIVDVEVTRTVAIDQALSRWWAGRNGADPLGGRFVPPSAIDRYYPDGQVSSVTRANADELARRATDLDWAVTLERIEA